jgi:hypothetical protein
MFRATGDTAAAMAKELAADAVAERLGAICVVQFNRDSEKGEKLKDERERLLGQRPLHRNAELGDYAGDDKADSRVADACAKHLTDKTGVTPGTEDSILGARTFG